MVFSPGVLTVVRICPLLCHQPKYVGPPRFPSILPLGIKHHPQVPTPAALCNATLATKKQKLFGFFLKNNILLGVFKTFSSL